MAKLVSDPKTIDRQHQEDRLREEVLPPSVGCPITFGNDAAPAVPRQIDGQEREVQHHPAEHTPDRLGTAEVRMAHEVRVRVYGGRQRAEADAGRERARKKHGDDENLAGFLVQRSALLADDGEPHGNQSDAAGCHMRNDERFEDVHNRHVIPIPPSS